MRIPAKRAIAAVVAVLMGSLAWFLAASFLRIREEDRKSWCVHNLKVLGIALHAYAKAHEGRFPESWSQLIPQYLHDDAAFFNEILVCPEERKAYAKTHGQALRISGLEDVDEHSSFVLVPERRVTDDKDAVLAYERGDNHGGSGRAELYVDGHAGWNPLLATPRP